jgi:nucleoside 2-deoxyribosyltransferase
MAFRVFLSYGASPDEQIAAWRLQTLATSYGMHVSVPARNGSGKGVDHHARRLIDQADCVLAIITGHIGQAVAQELNYALARGKLVVPLIRQGLSVPQALKDLRLFQFSAWNTGEAESEVMGFLQQQKFGKEKQQTIGALVAIGLGLFLLGALSKQQ